MITSRPQSIYRLVSLIALSGVLSACTLLGPDYVKPEVKVPDQWHAAHASASTQDLSHWWLLLNDPLLTQIIETSLQHSPDIASAQAKLREARAQRNIAGANHLPTITGSVSGNRSRSSGNTTQLFDAGFDASWEPDVFGGQQRSIEASEADLEVVQANLHDTQVSLAAEVALNYVELRNAQARLKIARDNLAAQTETLQITDWRVQAGLATALELEQAHTNREQTQATIPALNTAQLQAEHRLAILSGEVPGALHAQLEKVVALPTLPDQIAAGIPADTLRQRPDIRAAERRLAAETARIGVATANRYPSFNLNGSFGWRAATLGALGNAGTVASALAASVIGTIFDGGRLQGRIEVQNAVQAQALAAYEKSVLTALGDVENALVAYADNRERQATLQRAEASAQKAAQLARQLYESGNTDFQKVLDAERSRLSTEDSLANARAQGITTFIQLYKAMGGGWQENLEPAAHASTESKAHHE